MSNTAQAILGLTVGLLVSAIIFGAAWLAVVVGNALSDEGTYYIPEFKNCYVSNDGHNMCR